MNRKVLVRVVIGHVVLLVVLALSGLIQEWLTPEPIPVMEVSLVNDPFATADAAPEHIVPDPVSDPPPPEPDPVTPPPPPEPDPVTPPPPPEPKWEPKPVKEIKVNKTIKRSKPSEPQPKPVVKPVVDRQAVRDRFNEATLEVVNPATTVRRSGPPADEMARFRAKLARLMKEHWQEPAAWTGSGVPTAVVAVTIRSDGSVSGVRLVERSGYPSLDQSALAAARAVRRVLGVPRNFPSSETFEIEYVLKP